MQTASSVGTPIKAEQDAHIYNHVRTPAPLMLSRRKLKPAYGDCLLNDTEGSTKEQTTTIPSMAYYWKLKWTLVG